MVDLSLNTVPNLDPVRKNVAMVSGGCLWIPKVLWEEIGGFPDWFHTLGEDIYLCVSARLLGYPVKALKETGFYHWVGTNIGGGKIVGDRLKTTVNRRALSERNRTFVIAICYPSGVIELLLPLHILMLVFEGVTMSTFKLEYRLFREIYLNAVSQLWRNRKLLLRYRRYFQKRRRSNRADFFTVFQIMPYKLQMLIKHGMPEIMWNR
jgi:hypothetical protein